MSTEQREFSIGPVGCDVTSAQCKATITRLADPSALSVRDRDAIGERVVKTGEVFGLGGVPLMAVDGHLEALRKTLLWCLGLDRHDLVDAATEIIAEARPIALLGGEGTEARQLAAAIHSASPQREGMLMEFATSELPALGHFFGATVCVDLRKVHKITAPFARGLLDDRSRGLRAVFLADHERQLHARIDRYCDRVRTVTLTPLAQRPDDVIRLLGILWRELGSTRNVMELGPSARSLGTHHRWPRDLHELREHAPRLLAYVEHGRVVRVAARALGVSHQTLYRHLSRLGIKTVDEADP